MSHKRRKQGSADADFFVYTPGSEVPRDVTHALVHHSVEVLPARVFENCRHLKEVKIQEGLRKIGDDAFSGCVRLEHVTLPSTLTEIGSAAFSGCESLRELVLQEGLTEIDEYGFEYCSSLERIRVPSTVTTIFDSTFDNYTSLKVVRLLDGIRTIGECAFSGCKSLDDIMLPVTLTSIDRHTFTGCHSLKMVTICGGIQRIARGAFGDCTLLDHVMIRAKALVVTGTQRNRQFHVATDTFSPRGSTQVVIVSECFNSMRAADMSEAQLLITEILGLREGWGAQRERLRAFLAPYELRHKEKATTLLELGLWKAKMEESDNVNPEAREGCRVNCGAAIIVPNVLPFL